MPTKRKLDRQKPCSIEQSNSTAVAWSVAWFWESKDPGEFDPAILCRLILIYLMAQRVFKETPNSFNSLLSPISPPTHSYTQIRSCATGQVVRPVVRPVVGQSVHSPKKEKEEGPNMKLTQSTSTFLTGVTWKRLFSLDQTGHTGPRCRSRSELFGSSEQPKTSETRTEVTWSKSMWIPEGFRFELFIILDRLPRLVEPT